MYYEDLKTNNDDLVKPKLYTGSASNRKVPSENKTSGDDGSEPPKVNVDYDADAIAAAAVKVDEIKSGDPGDFKYEDFNFSNDPLFQMYQSMYMGNAQKAMKGAIADSALLTGGYGNSWAQSAGQRAYDDTMDGFYSMIPSLYSAAYGKYSDEKQRAEDEHAKKVSAWNLEMAAANSALEDAIDSAQQDVLDDYLPYIESGKMTWDDVYEALGDLVYADAEGNEVPLFTKEDQKAYEDAYNASVTAKAANDQGGAEPFYKYIFAGTDGTGAVGEDGKKDGTGNYIFYRDGKKYEYAPGINPYTGSTNSDIKYGTFSNGYQPNNVASYYKEDKNPAEAGKLSKTGRFVEVNGVRQNVWKTPDGETWVWDGTINQYINEKELEYTD